jgi:oligopeptide transport system substrate-binding protein
MTPTSSTWSGLACAVALLAAGPAAAESVLRLANAGEPKSLDPHKVSGTWENRVVGEMFMGLVTEDAAARSIPGAATAWEVSEDGTVYTFTLREHVWGDGRPVTAADFVYSLKRILDPKTAAEYASLLYTIKNARAVNSGAAGLETLGVKATGPRTLEIALEFAAPYFIDQLTHYTAYPVPAHLIEQHGAQWVKPGTITGNGAYVVTEWTPNTQIVSVKNPRFHDAANVKIDKIVYVPGEERNAATKQFRAGEIDVQYDFASEQIDFLKANHAAETRIAPYLGIYYYPMNTSKPPFDDPRVRLALSMAVDRETLTGKVLRSGEQPACSFVPPGTGSYGTPARLTWCDLPLAERQAKAKALLAEAGYGPGKPLRTQLRYNTSETHKKAAIAVAAMWKPLGVEAELFNSEVKVHYDALKQADFEIARAGWIADYNDPQNFLYLLDSRTGVNNYGRYKNAELDRLMDEANRTLDQRARMDLMRKAEQIALDESATMPLWYYVSKNLVATKVEGWVDNTKDIHRVRWLAIAGS